MFNAKMRLACMVALGATLISLQGCDNGHQESAQKVEIKPAPKMTNDATSYAQQAWALINQVDHLVYEKQLTEIDEKVRKPLRQLGTDWRIKVKMTDSVTEGKYALCRKTLTSLDTWARETLENTNTVAEKKADYERDKAQCKDAIENPSLGNTAP